MRSTEALRDLLEPALASAGLELWDVEVSPQVVRVSVDRPGGIDLDSLATVANSVVSPVLDDHPELTPDSRFSLEVSSPGLERALRTVEQYRRYIGAEVSIKTKVAVAGSRRHRGQLLSADERGVRIREKDQVDPGTGAPSEVDLPLDQIDRARTVLDWGPSQDTPRARSVARRSSARKPRAGAGVPAAQTSSVATTDSKDTGS